MTRCASIEMDTSILQSLTQNINLGGVFWQSKPLGVCKNLVVNVLKFNQMFYCDAIKYELFDLVSIKPFHFSRFLGDGWGWVGKGKS